MTDTYDILMLIGALILAADPLYAFLRNDHREGSSPTPTSPERRSCRRASKVAPALDGATKVPPEASTTHARHVHIPSDFIRFA
jgi:hypothetical protein